ncbi:WbqC family protein [Kitasatospora sp. NPDC059327]|uniref:WbqC family protein n=1 Tax=Kitasatospora sp. NPDC059327 TaxID=3346803 RepID=UPI0036A3AB4B
MGARYTVLAAHQPAYLPWCGFFSRLLEMEAYVALDHVQFSERGRQHRNQVRGPASGLPVRLTVPVRHSFGQSLTEVRTADQAWPRRHWRTLTQAYGRAPYWTLYADRLRAVYERPWTHLVDLNLSLTRLLLHALDLPARVVRSSELAPRSSGTGMLVDLCRLRGADTLLVGTGALGYLDGALLREHRIQVQVATYTHPPYGADLRGWAPNLSVLDLLMHEGPRARGVLAAGARTRVWEPSVEAVTL